VDDLLDDPRITAIGMLVEAHAAVSSRAERLLHTTFGFPLPWFEVLLRLGRTPGHALRMSELAAQVSFSASGLTRLVDRMSAAGLVRRDVCAEDRRGALCVLTDEGEARLRAALPVHLELVQAMVVDVLSPEELDTLTALLRRIRDAAARSSGADAGACDAAVAPA
jgi:DNA-binding MarR family transcriptional regulator